MQARFQTPIKSSTVILGVGMGGTGVGGTAVGVEGTGAGWAVVGPQPLTISALRMSTNPKVDSLLFILGLLSWMVSLPGAELIGPALSHLAGKEAEASIVQTTLPTENKAWADIKLPSAAT